MEDQHKTLKMNISIEDLHNVILIFKTIQNVSKQQLPKWVKLHLIVEIMRSVGSDFIELQSARTYG